VAQLKIIRNLIFIVFASTSLFAFAEDPRGVGILQLADNGQYQYTEVITVDGVDADELHSRMLSWIAINYNSAQSVVQLNDENSK
jgi:hypothetical protein